MKQTAIEWLWRWINDNQEATIEQGNKAFHQALEMEKEQIIEFFMKGKNTYPSEYVLDNQQIAEQYYNETYNSK